MPFRIADEFIADHKPLIYSEVGSRKLRLVADSDGAGFVQMVEALGYETHILSSDGALAALGKNVLADKSDGILNVVFNPVR